METVKGVRRIGVVNEGFDPKIGLCSVCLNTRPLENGRGSTFYFCELALTDQRFRKYPQLPVVECAGFEPRALAMKTQ